MPATGEAGVVAAGSVCILMPVAGAAAPVAGALFSGAPSGMAQVWPGWPCGGLSATVETPGVACWPGAALAGWATAGSGDGGGGVAALSLLPKPELQAAKKEAAISTVAIFCIRDCCCLSECER